MPSLQSITLAALVLLAQHGLQAQELTVEELFENSIRPLFIEHCQECHGAEKQWGNLRLDSAEAVQRGGDTGPVIVPGKPEESLLYQAVLRSGDIEMPPDMSLNNQQIHALKQWITLGAAWPKKDETATAHAPSWQTHWAFQPLRPELPEVVDRQQWCRNPIDHFVLHKLMENQLEPSPEADRRTLLRRLTFSLTGLPPSYEEVESFIRDVRPDAYERQVERLLDSPRYGEHLARAWLDIARYSDSKGYVYAREERFFVGAATYRDWVIQAFNNDLPYDRFLMLQLAADQCDSEHPESLAAMGLLTLGRRFLGVTHDIIDDRIDVVGRGTLGLTVACARCHDHKYDPIPTSDYYSLYGVFQNSTDRQVDLTGIQSVQPDTGFQEELQKRQQVLAERMSASRLETSHRVRKRLADYLFAQSELHKYHQEGFDIIIQSTDLIPAFVRRWEAYLARRDANQESLFGPWFRFQSIPVESFKENSPLVSKEVRIDEKTHAWIAELFVSPPANLREVADRYGQLFDRIDQQWKEQQTSGNARPAEVDAKWLNMAEPLLNVLYGLQAPCEVPDEEIIATETYFDSATCTELWKLQGEVDRWRLQSNQAAPVALAVFDRASLVEPRIFRRGNPANKGATVQRHFLSFLSNGSPEPFSQGSGRLELAQRIVDPQNPLTPRVWVNRLWQHHLGEGLVRTPSDFGLRSQPPSHPELLDWLATQLIAENWSSKAIQRLILTSATFRQASWHSPVNSPLGSAVNSPASSSVVSAAQASEGIGRQFAPYATAHQLDPENRLLWRVAPRRLRFEELRDSLLTVSGDIQHRLGGKAVEMISTNDSNQRRSIYGLIDRQFLPSTLRVFDFANPDLHIGRRSETQVPQQALYFLNHPFLAHRARTLTLGLELTSDKAAGELAASIDRMYQRVFQRNPTEVEQAAALELLMGFEELPSGPSQQSLAWSYGFGEVDEARGILSSFEKLPHFSGSAWQGGTAYPDGKLGWVQLTASGGHPGNDLAHACVRRWTAPAAMSISIQSLARHDPEVSDGVRFRIFSSRQGQLAAVKLRAAEASLDVAQLDVQAGETIDFVVDILGELNSDQHLWKPVIRQLAGVVGNAPEAQESATLPGDSAPLAGGVARHAELQVWDAGHDFSGPTSVELSRAEQLAQVLLLTNEFAFVD